jgi:peroxiredoxin
VLEEVYQRYKKRDVAFIGIFVEDTEANARAFLNTHPMSFPTGYDWPLALAKPLGFRAMPYTVVISQQGQVAHRWVGPVTEADLVATIEGLLAQL